MILAGVSISLLLSQYGIIGRAQVARETQRNAQNLEEQYLQNADLYIEEQIAAGEGGAGDITVEDAINSSKVFDGTEKPAKDKYGNEIKVPKGFKITNDATTVDKGIVIEDVTAGNITNEGVTTNPTLGSQFVWVPVGKIYTDVSRTEANAKTITLGRYDFNESTGEESTYTGSYAEEGREYSNTRAKDISAFKTSVSTNHGYYIGRYEAGIIGTTTSSTEASQTRKVNGSDLSFTKDVNTSGVITVKEGVGVWNNIRQPYAATVCRNMYATKATSGVESDLINSYAWDTAIAFINKCGTKSNYNEQYRLQNTLTTTGNACSGSTYDVQCNIYDMAGNVCEWSTETTNMSSYPCVDRGVGFHDGTITTTRRHYSQTTDISYAIGFRPILYL